jgi:hypothetical protein
MQPITPHPIGSSGAPGGGTVTYPAERPHLVELQIDAVKLGRLVMNRLRAESIPTGQEFELDSGGPTYVVDHIEIDQPAILDAGPNPPANGADHPQLKVTITIFLKDKDKLLNPTTTHQIALQPSLDLYFKLTSNSGQLCIDFNTVTSVLPLPPPALSAINAALASLDLCTSLDLSALPSVLGSLTATQAKVAADVNFSLLSVRLELGDSYGAWASFAAAPVQSFLNGMDWALLLQADLVVGAFEQLVAGMMLTRDDIAVNQGPSGSWTASTLTIEQDNDADFAGGVTLTVGGDSWAAACDIGFSATIKAGLRVPSKNSIEVTVGFDVSPNYWDAFWCFGPIGDIAAAAYTFTPDQKDIPSACALQHDNLLVCTYPISLAPLTLGASLPFGTLMLEKYVASDAGPILGGSLDLLAVGKAKLTMDIDSGLEWRVLGGCGNFSVGAEAIVKLTGTELPAGAPVKLDLPIKVLNDPLNLFRPHLVIDPSGASWLPVDVTLSFQPGGVPLDAPYWQNPYDLILLVETTAGCQAVSLGKLPAYTEQQITQIGIGIPVLEANCDAPQTGLFGIAGKFDPHWLVDPGPEGSLRYWEGLVTGAARGDVFELVDETGSVMRSTVNAAGNAVLNGIFSDRGFQVTRTAAQSATGRVMEDAARDGKGGPPRLRERQTLMIKKHEIALDGDITYLAADQLSGVPILIAATASALSVFDMTAPGLPHLIGEAAGVRGAVGSGTDLVYWGHHGVAFWSREPHVGGTPILNAIRLGEYLAALSVDGVVVYDAKLHPVGCTELRHGGRLVAVRRRLLIVVPDGLAIVDIRNPAHPTVVGTARTGRIEGLSAWAGPKSGGTVTVQRNGEFVTLDADQLPVISRLATYHRKPWTFGAAQAAEFWARPEDDAGHIGIYAIGQSRRTYPG